MIGGFMLLYNLSLSKISLELSRLLGHNFDLISPEFESFDFVSFEEEVKFFEVKLGFSTVPFLHLIIIIVWFGPIVGKSVVHFISFWPVWFVWFWPVWFILFSLP